MEKDPVFARKYGSETIEEKRENTFDRYKR